VLLLYIPSVFPAGVLRQLSLPVDHLIFSLPHLSQYWPLGALSETLCSYQRALSAVVTILDDNVLRAHAAASFLAGGMILFELYKRQAR
jgi:hypothetical protein